MDGGLRKAIVAQVHARMPAIIEDEGAWDEYVTNEVVVKAVHVFQCDMRDEKEGVTRVMSGKGEKREKVEQKGRAQVKSSGAYGGEMRRM